MVKPQSEPEEARDAASRGNNGSWKLPLWATFKTHDFCGFKASEKPSVLLG